MKDKIEIYCPLCLKRGHKKLLGKVDRNARGKIYFWCQYDRKEVEIDLDRLKERDEYVKNVFR